MRVSSALWPWQPLVLPVLFILAILVRNAVIANYDLKLLSSWQKILSILPANFPCICTFWWNVLLSFLNCAVFLLLSFQSSLFWIQVLYEICDFYNIFLTTSNFSTLHPDTICTHNFPQHTGFCLAWPAPQSNLIFVSKIRVSQIWWWLFLLLLVIDPGYLQTHCYAHLRECSSYQVWKGNTNA